MDLRSRAGWHRRGRETIQRPAPQPSWPAPGTRPPQGPVQHRGGVGLAGLLHRHQVIPPVGEGTDLVIALQPAEAMQLQTAGAVDVIRRQSLAATAVEQHQRAPVLFGISALNFAEKLHAITGIMAMVHAQQSIAVVAHFPQLNNISPAQHVAIHEDGPSLISHQAGHQKTAEREGCALLRVARAVVEPLGLQLRCDQRCDRQRCTAVLVETVDQNIGGGPLALVVTDEDRDRRNHRGDGEGAGSCALPAGAACLSAVGQGQGLARRTVRQATIEPAAGPMIAASWRALGCRGLQAAGSQR